VRSVFGSVHFVLDSDIEKNPKSFIYYQTRLGLYASICDLWGGHAVGASRSQNPRFNPNPGRYVL